MEQLLGVGGAQLQLLLLVLLRATGLFLIAPIFSDGAVPVRFRVGLAFLVSLLVVGLPTVGPLPEVMTTGTLAWLAIREIFVGVAIGFVFQLLFYAVQTAGTLVGFQIGLAMASVFDPSSNSQQSVIGRVWFVSAIVLFMAIDGHHLLLQGMSDSYRAIPMAATWPNLSSAELFMSASAAVFVIALKLASPIVMTFFITDAALGIIAKMMPTMNVFFVGFALKAGLGLAVIGLALPAFAYVLRQSTGMLSNELDRLLIVMGQA